MKVVTLFRLRTGRIVITWLKVLFFSPAS